MHVGNVTSLLAGSMLKTPLLKHSLKLLGWQRDDEADERQLRAYIDDPVSFVHKRALALLRSVCTRDVTRHYIATQLEPVRDHLNMMRVCIPNLIESSRKLLASIANDKRSRRELEERYLGLEEDIPRLQECLALHGLRHVRSYSRRRAQLRFAATPERGVFCGGGAGSRQQQQRGLFAQISAARLLDGDTAADDGGENDGDEDATGAVDEASGQAVSVKVYHRRVSSLQLLKEEQLLR